VKRREEMRREEKNWKGKDKNDFAKKCQNYKHFLKGFPNNISKSHFNRTENETNYIVGLWTI